MTSTRFALLLLGCAILSGTTHAVHPFIGQDIPTPFDEVLKFDVASRSAAGDQGAIYESCPPMGLDALSSNQCTLMVCEVCRDQRDLYLRVLGEALCNGAARR